MSGNLIPKNVNDFRLLSKRCYQQLIRLEYVNPVLSSFIAGLRLKSAGIRFERAPRFGGKSKAYSWRVIGFGTLLTVNVLLFEFLFPMLGLIAEYVGMTHQEVKRLPNFIVKDT